MNQLPDEQILAGLQSEIQAERDRMLRYLYTRDYPVIAAFITKNNGTEADAADIFQDAIIVFYEKIRLKELTLSCSIRTYLYSVCKNLWRNSLRRQKRLTGIDDTIESIPIPAESLTIVETNERQTLVAELMNRLGDDCKRVLTLFYFERQRMKTIAEQMGFANEQVAKNKKSNCMKRLKALLQSLPGFKNALK